MNFVPLHVHTEYSIRDSTNKIKKYINRCKELGIQSASITDHGFMGGAYKFYKECKANNIKPILGIEMYYTQNNECKDNYHLILYAKNNIGYKNLCKLSSDAYINNFYKKPRTTKEELKKYSEGLICTPACCFGMAQQMLLNGDNSSCVNEIKELKSIFKEDFYLEIGNHSLDLEVTIADFFRNLGNELKIKIIPGLDAHYTLSNEKELHNIFKQIAYGSVGKDKDDSFNGDGYHILNYEEMLERFNREEIDNTNEVADKCNVSFDFIGYHLPKFPIPVKNKDSYEYLKDLCYKGLKGKGLENKKDYIDRLEYELNMLHMADLENYILIVADYCNWCKENNIIVGPGRGSFAGSLISFLSGITKVDPLKYNLLFQRAVNTGRSLQYSFGI